MTVFYKGSIDWPRSNFIYQVSAGLVEFLVMTLRLKINHVTTTRHYKKLDIPLTKELFFGFSLLAFFDLSSVFSGCNVTELLSDNMLCSSFSLVILLSWWGKLKLASEWLVLLCPLPSVTSEINTSSLLFCRLLLCTSTS